MHRQNILAIKLLGVVLVVVLTAGYASGRGPFMLSVTVTRFRMQQQKRAAGCPGFKERGPIAPEFATGD